MPAGGERLGFRDANHVLEPLSEVTVVSLAEILMELDDVAELHWRNLIMLV
jgi:hypothetical protein